MTKDQLSFILNKYGGKDDFIKKEIFTIYCDNNKEIMITPDMSEEDRVTALKFDDSNELIEYTDNYYIWHNLNNFTPTNTTIFIPYEVIQSITVLNSLSKDLTVVPKEEEKDDSTTEGDGN